MDIDMYAFYLFDEYSSVLVHVLLFTLYPVLSFWWILYLCHIFVHLYTTADFDLF